MTIAEQLANEFPTLNMGAELAYFERVVKVTITAPYVPAFRSHLENRVRFVAGIAPPKFEAAMYGVPRDYREDNNMEFGE